MARKFHNDLLALLLFSPLLCAQNGPTITLAQIDIRAVLAVQQQSLLAYGRRICQ
jgi:hypothetical protein